MKSKSLPNLFPVDKLVQFDFGDADAFRDLFLFNAFCYTDFVELCRQNKRTLLIGPKGSGKTAVFKAFAENQLSPLLETSQNPLIIGISDELKYLETEKIIDEKFSIYGYSSDFKYALLWDFYCLFRTLLEIQKHYYEDFTSDLKKLALFFQHISIPEKSNLTIFLEKLKNVKFSASISDGTMVYTGTAEYAPGTGITIENQFPLYTLKQQINQILAKHGTVLWIMFDKLDDFLLREEYDVQRKLLQGLVTTEDSYSKYSNIYLKIFLRPDLYHKIDFGFIGYDKLEGRKVYFKWHPTEIRRFIAQRIAFNIFNILKLKYLSVTVEDPVQNKDEQLSKNSITDLNADKGIISKIINDRRQGRSISMSDELSKGIILKIFPKQVFHYDQNKRKHPISIFDYFKTHFNFADDQPTPRSIIHFLDLCIQKTISYYNNNKDEISKVTLDRNEEYPLIKRTSVEEAYGALSKSICEYITRYDPQWYPYIDKIFNEKGTKRRFTYKQLNNLLKIDEKQLAQLIAYLQHIGCIKRVTSEIRDKNKEKYELPIFIQAKDFYK